MDIVTVPLVWPDTPVSITMESMKQRQRSGVVLENVDDTYRLLYLGDLLRSRSMNLPTVGLIPGGHPVLVADPRQAQQFQVDLIRPMRTWAAYEAMMDALSVEYVLIGLASTEVMIATRHEGYTDALKMTGGFECSGTPTHYFPEPYVEVGKQCPLYAVCSGTIRPA